MTEGRSFVESSNQVVSSPEIAFNMLTPESLIDAAMSLFTAGANLCLNIIPGLTHPQLSLLAMWFSCVARVAS